MVPRMKTIKIYYLGFIIYNVFKKESWKIICIRNKNSIYFSLINKIHQMAANDKWSLLQQKRFSLFNGVLHLCRFSGKVLSFLLHVFPCLHQICHQRLKFLFAKLEMSPTRCLTLNPTWAKKSVEAEGWLTSSRACCCDATSTNLFNSCSRFSDTLWKWIKPAKKVCSYKIIIMSSEKR